MTSVCQYIYGRWLHPSRLTEGLCSPSETNKSFYKFGIVYKPPEMQLKALALVLAFQTRCSGSDLMAQGDLPTQSLRVKHKFSFQILRKQFLFRLGANLMEFETMH